MFKKIKITYLLVLGVLVASCSEYQKALKSEDTKIKYEMAEKLYDAGKYSKANRLYEQILPKYTGKPQGERVVYMYADGAYKSKDFYLAAYQFERFASSYPKSEKAEEAAFYSAKSSYELSPRYSIDQTETNEAINKLQSFINRYPDSEWLPEANKMVQELTSKLEKKDLEVAKLYSKTYYYKSCIKCIDNFLIDYPGSDYREEALYVKLDASYKLAINSYEYLVKDRLQEAENAYKDLMKYFPNSKFAEEANDINEDIQKELSKRS